MKSIRTLLFATIVIFSSCEDTMMDTQFISEHTKDFENTEAQQENTEQPMEYETNNEINEGFLFMISYLCSRAIIENEEARVYFNEVLISSEADHFDLGDLLQMDTSTYNPFEDEFYEQFKKYNYQIIVDTVASDTVISDFPELTVIPPSAQTDPPASDYGHTNVIITGEYVSVLASLIERHCLQFYFPNIDLLGSTVNMEDHMSLIRTTWHPLNEDNFNAGMELNADGGKYKDITMNEAEEEILLLVLRPVNTDHCQYGTIDYTTFLSH